MLYLVLSIITNAALVLILKAFGKWNVNLFHAIVFNYLAASLSGFIFNGNFRQIPEVIHAPWLGMALLLGLFFISLFYIIGISTQTAGVAATSVANKMSLVIPVVAAVLYYGDSLSKMKIFGIALALTAVYLTSAREKQKAANAQMNSFFPVLIFIGSGILDALINYSQKTFHLENESGLFIPCAFAAAASVGLLILSVKIFLKKEIPHIRSVAAGILLGITNFFSIHFLVLALGSPTMQSSVVFPLNNMGIVALSALAAFILFNEKLSAKNMLGIALSLIAIAIITFS